VVRKVTQVNRTFLGVGEEQNEGTTGRQTKIGMVPGHQVLF
jgi:hypothetical protein